MVEEEVAPWLEEKLAPGIIGLGSYLSS